LTNFELANSTFTMRWLFFFFFYGKLVFYMVIEFFLSIIFSGKSFFDLEISFFIFFCHEAENMLWNIFLDSRKPHFSESTLCGSRWTSKTPAVPDSYKRCTPWLELETCCAHLKPFVITLRPLGTMLWNMLPLYNAYKAKSLKNIFFLTFHNKVIKKNRRKYTKK